MDQHHLLAIHCAESYKIACGAAALPWICQKSENKNPLSTRAREQRVYRIPWKEGGVNSGRILPGRGIAFDSRSIPSSERKIRCCAFLGILRHIPPHLLSIKWEYSIKRTTKSMGFATPGKQPHVLLGAL
jgi:hypothetical protein